MSGFSGWHKTQSTAVSLRLMNWNICIVMVWFKDEWEDFSRDQRSNLKIHVQMQFAQSYWYTVVGRGSFLTEIDVGEGGFPDLPRILSKSSLNTRNIH